VTPGGTPITRLTLEHCSEQPQAGTTRQVRLRIGVALAGESLDRSLPRLEPGAHVRVSGFLARAGYRDGDYRLVVHAETLETLD